MPYSAEKLLKSSMQKYINKLVNIADEAIDITTEQVCKDLSDTFDKCIDEFYSYETKRYYRHEVGRGTGTGWNLYMANQFRVVYSHGSAQGMHLGWNGTEMSPYKLSKGVTVSTEHVLDSVMKGYRFDGDGSYKYPRMIWEIENPIQTEYFGAITGKTPNQIFEKIMEKMYTVRKDLVKKNFSLLYRKTLK